MLNFRATYATFSCNSALARLETGKREGQVSFVLPSPQTYKGGIFLHIKTGPEPLENGRNNLLSSVAEGSS